MSTTPHTFRTTQDMQVNSAFEQVRERLVMLGMPADGMADWPWTARLHLIAMDQDLQVLHAKIAGLQEQLGDRRHSSDPFESDEADELAEPEIRPSTTVSRRNSFGSAG